MIIESFSLVITIAALVVVIYLDNKTSGIERLDFSENLQAVQRLLFSNAQRTFCVYAICLLGLIVPPIIESLPYLSFNLFWVVYYSILASFVILPAIVLAKLREGKMNGGYPPTLNFNVDTPCFKELREKIAKTHEPRVLHNMHNLLTLLKRDDLLELITKKSNEVDLSEKCIDEILGLLFFDKYETTDSRKLQIGWFSRKDFKQYAENRSALLHRDDKIAQVFQESLTRWRSSNESIEE